MALSLGVFEKVVHHPTGRRAKRPIGASAQLVIRPRDGKPGRAGSDRDGKTLQRVQVRDEHGGLGAVGARSTRATPPKAGFYRGPAGVGSGRQAGFRAAERRQDRMPKGQTGRRSCFMQAGADIHSSQAGGDFSRRAGWARRRLAEKRRHLLQNRWKFRHRGARPALRMRGSLRSHGDLALPLC